MCDRFNIKNRTINNTKEPIPPIIYTLFCSKKFSVTGLIVLGVGVNTLGVDLIVLGVGVNTLGHAGALHEITCLPSGHDFPVFDAPVQIS